MSCGAQADSRPMSVENEIQIQPSLMTHQTCRGNRPVYKGDKRSLTDDDERVVDVHAPKAVGGLADVGP